MNKETIKRSLVKVFMAVFLIGLIFFLIGITTEAVREIKQGGLKTMVESVWEGEEQIPQQQQMQIQEQQVYVPFCADCDKPLELRKK